MYGLLRRKRHEIKSPTLEISVGMNPRERRAEGQPELVILRDSPLVLYSSLSDL